MKREGGWVGGIESEVLHLFTSISLTQLQTLILHFILYLSLSLSLLHYFPYFMSPSFLLSFNLSISLFLSLYFDIRKCCKANRCSSIFGTIKKTSSLWVENRSNCIQFDIPCNVTLGLYWYCVEVWFLIILPRSKMKKIVKIFQIFNGRFDNRI